MMTELDRLAAARPLLTAEPDEVMSQAAQHQLLEAITASPRNTAQASSHSSRTQRSRPSGLRWGRLSAVAACAAAAAVGVGLLLPAGGPGGPDTAAAAPLDKLAVIAKVADDVVGPGQFAYVLEDSEQTMSRAEATTPVLPGESREGNLSLSRGEQWTAPDGTQWRTVFLAGGQSCLAKHDHVVTAGGPFDYANASAPELASLPTDPSELASFIDAHPAGDNRGARDRFTVVGDLLRSGLAGRDLRSAALRLLAQTSGLTAATDAHDAAGRPAIRVDYSFGYGVESLFFDARTSRVLEEQTTQGQYLFRAVVRESKVVDSIASGLGRCPGPTTKPG